MCHFLIPDVSKTLTELLEIRAVCMWMCTRRSCHETKITKTKLNH